MKNINLNKKLWVMSIVLTMLITSLVTTTIAQLGNNTTISEGVYPSGIIIIYQEGTIYYAKNSYGFFLYKGLNADIAIQTSINILYTSGISGKIFIKAGDYYLNGAGMSFPYGAIQLKTNIILQGEGAGTILHGLPKDQSELIRIENCSNVKICDMALVGELGYDTNGIGLTNTNYNLGEGIVFENLIITHFQVGIAVHDNVGTVDIINCICDGNERDGLELLGGILKATVLGGSYCRTSGKGNFGAGIRLSAGTVSGSIIGARCYENYREGIQIKYPSGGSTQQSFKIIGCGIFDNSRAGDNLYDGIYLEYATDVIIMGCTSYNVMRNDYIQRYGINEAIGCNYNIIMGNDVLGSGLYGNHEGINKTGVNTIVEHNIIPLT